MMAHSLVLTPEAETDLAHACRWYEDQRIGLGQDFLLCVEQVFDQIRRSPDSHAVGYRDVRQALVRRFPYVVCYRSDRRTVRVIAVYHGHRDPRSWQKRQT